MSAWRRVATCGAIAWTFAVSARAWAEMPPVHVHGLLDVTFAGRGEAAEANAFTRNDSPFDAYGARLFVDAKPNDHLQVFTQLGLRDASGLYVDGAYALYTPSPDRDLHVMAGKIPWPIGTWAPRTYSNKNPLIGTPLMYQYHTTLVWYDFPASADQLLSRAGSGQNAETYASGARGMPVVDDSYWDVGVVVTGSQRPIEYAIGGVSGTPGWGDTGIDENNGKTVLGRIGLMPAPFVRLGFSGSYGPYLNESLNPLLPTGKTGNDYHQVLLMSDLQLEIGNATVIAEGFANTWETPTVGDLDVLGGYLEGKLAVAAGLYAAARWDGLRFSDLVDSGGTRHTWDRDVDRLELGMGYRVERGTLVKGVWQRHTERARGAEEAEHYDLVGAQLSIAF